MKCRTTNCNHHIRRGVNSKKRLSGSWKKYLICVCCAKELKRVGGIEEDFRGSPICSRFLGIEKKVNSPEFKKEFLFMPKNKTPLNQITFYE